MHFMPATFARTATFLSLAGVNTASLLYTLCGASERSGLSHVVRSWLAIPSKRSAGRNCETSPRDSHS